MSTGSTPYQSPQIQKKLQQVTETESVTATPNYDRIQQFNQYRQKMHAKAKFSRSKSLSILVKSQPDADELAAMLEREKMERKRRAISVGKTVSASPMRARNQEHSFSPSPTSRRNSIIRSANVALSMKFKNADPFGLRQDADIGSPQRGMSPMSRRMSRRGSLHSTDGASVTSARNSLSKKELDEALETARERMLKKKQGLKTRYKSPSSAPVLRSRPMAFEVPRVETVTRPTSMENSHRITRVAKYMRKLKNLDVMSDNNLTDLKNIDEVNAKTPSTPECPKNMYDVTGFMETKRFASRSKSRSRSRRSSSPTPANASTSQGEDPRDTDAATQKKKRVKKVVKRVKVVVRKNSIPELPSPILSPTKKEAFSPNQKLRTKRSAKKRLNVSAASTQSQNTSTLPQEPFIDGDTLPDTSLDLSTNSQRSLQTSSIIDRDSLLHHLSQPETTFDDIINGIKLFSEKQKNRQLTIPDISRLLDDVRNAKNAISLNHVQTKKDRSHLLSEIRDKRKRDSLKKGKTKPSRTEVLAQIRQKPELQHADTVDKSQSLLDHLKMERTPVKRNAKEADASAVDESLDVSQDILSESQQEISLMDEERREETDADTEENPIDDVVEEPAIDSMETETEETVELVEQQVEENFDTPDTLGSADDETTEDQTLRDIPSEETPFHDSDAVTPAEPIVTDESTRAPVEEPSAQEESSTLVTDQERLDEEALDNILNISEGPDEDSPAKDPTESQDDRTLQTEDTTEENVLTDAQITNSELADPVETSETLLQHQSQTTAEETLPHDTHDFGQDRPGKAVEGESLTEDAPAADDSSSSTADVHSEESIEMHVEVSKFETEEQTESALEKHDGDVREHVSDSHETDDDHASDSATEDADAEDESGHSEEQYENESAREDIDADSISSHADDGYLHSSHQDDHFDDQHPDELENSSQLDDLDIKPLLASPSHSEAEDLDIAEELAILNSKVDADSPNTPPVERGKKKSDIKANPEKKESSSNLLKRVGSFFWGSKNKSNESTPTTPTTVESPAFEKVQEKPLDTLESEDCTCNLFSESRASDAKWRFVAFVEHISEDRIETFTKEMDNTGNPHDFLTIIYGHPTSLQQSTGAKWKRSDMNVDKLNFGPADEGEKLRMLLSMMRKMEHLQQSIFINGVRVHPQEAPSE